MFHFKYRWKKTFEDIHSSHIWRRTQSMKLLNVQPYPLYKPVPVHAMKAYTGSRGIAPVILKLGTRYEWFSYRPGQFAPGNEPQYPMNKRTGGHHSRSGRFGKEINLLSVPGLNTWPSSPCPSHYIDCALPAAFNPNNIRFTLNLDSIHVLPIMTQTTGHTQNNINILLFYISVDEFSQY
jgi:hypothetical protein